MLSSVLNCSRCWPHTHVQVGVTEHSPILSLYIVLDLLSHPPHTQQLSNAERDFIYKGGSLTNP